MGGSLELYVTYPAEYKTVTIWGKTKEACIVQEWNNGKKSKKAVAKIKYYNNKPYITCKGHRYYLDTFIKIEL